MSTLMHELPRRHRITVEHFYRMAEAGLFAEDERVELVDGEVIDVPPMGHAHAGVLDYLAKMIMSSVGARAIVRQQLPLRLGEDSEPLPDIAVARLRDDLYMRAHPAGTETLLVIEISSTTLHFDRTFKVPMYARHGVPEVWVVDVGGLHVHRYRSPMDNQYASTTTLPLATRISLDALGCEIDLQSLATRLTESQAI
jgi:Uma2 family endonuclease